MNERRIFERFPARFPVRFKQTSNDFGTDVFLRDSSAQGAKITTKQRLYFKDCVSLEVKLPDGTSPLNLNGRVVWIKEVSSGLWDIGLEFHKIQFMEIQRIYRWAHV